MGRQYQAKIFCGNKACDHGQAQDQTCNLLVCCIDALGPEDGGSCDRTSSMKSLSLAGWLYLTSCSMAGSGIDALGPEDSSSCNKT